MSGKKPIVGESKAEPAPVITAAARRRLLDEAKEKKKSDLDHQVKETTAHRARMIDSFLSPRGNVAVQESLRFPLIHVDSAEIPKWKKRLTEYGYAVTVDEQHFTAEIPSK